MKWKKGYGIEYRFITLKFAGGSRADVRALARLRLSPVSSDPREDDALPRAALAALAHGVARAPRSPGCSGQCGTVSGGRGGMGSG